MSKLTDPAIGVEDFVPSNPAETWMHAVSHRTPEREWPGVPPDVAKALTIMIGIGAANEGYAAINVAQLADIAKCTQTEVGQALAILVGRGWLAPKGQTVVGYFQLTVPEPAPPPRPRSQPATLTNIYRWFDENGRLLYVGITNDLATRQTSHAKRSAWAEFARYCDVTKHPDRETAADGERAAIEFELPVFNRLGNDNPAARARVVAYLTERNRLDLLSDEATAKRAQRRAAAGDEPPGPTP